MSKTLGLDRKTFWWQERGELPKPCGKLVSDPSYEWHESFTYQKRDVIKVKDNIQQWVSKHLIIMTLKQGYQYLHGIKK